MTNSPNLNQKSKIVSIDEIYLKQSFNIRMDFENINLLIVNREKEISKLKECIETLKSELKKDQKKIKGGDKSIMNNVYRVLGDLEDTTQKLKGIIDPIEKKMEELRKDEVVLHETLKEKYPHVTDDELKESIINYIVERKRDL